MVNKATIIILDFMKAPQVLENVNSFLEQKHDFDLKIFVVDNSCNQKNAEMLSHLSNIPNLELFINKKNTGYPKAYNQFNNNIESDYILVLNPDIEWKDENAFKKMIDYMDSNSDIGVLGPKQIEKNGNIAMTIRAFPRFYLQVARRTWLRRLPILKKKVEYDEMRHLDYEKTQDVDWLQSSCIVVRSDLWKNLGGLKEDYFLFMTDVELCFDSWKNKKRVVYFPEAKVYADGKRVSAGGFFMFFKNWVLRQHVKDSLKYRFKHFFDKNPRLEYYKND